jgi:hypothetical protein
MQIDVHPSGGGAPTSWVTEAGGSWKVLNADSWFRPGNKADGSAALGDQHLAADDGPGGSASHSNYGCGWR